MTFKERWNIFSIGILIAAGLWIILTSIFSGAGTVIPTVAAREGFLAPEIELDTLEGEAVQLSSLKGQVVIVNFWASWCSPCRIEMPAIQKIYATYHDLGVEVLAVNTTNQDDPGNVGQFVSERGLTFPILLDYEGAVARRYAVRALPTTYIVGKDGIIQKMLIGGPLPEALLSSQIEQLIGEER
jgi:cytochrome c biogenesis protein CcmG, thiol:disulfide interchange protein DsbE